ncbi:formate--tetrahydrofolate ligase [Prevotella communis]|uniref:formate--tetrahydrofolate ligase n=1 Tax=Prevotella communis TaxID=2913614 RepID=UPI001EDBDDB3|nr:formate--tetrahydrofolate ligase [Prevotella communis]UKK61880.1 formate--tetrahydrofolate ligase [Prevotella communis]UKK64707.1 formate--tetrahydrofolate ligase [Prevotella communis]
MKTDIQIARESELRPISDIAEQLGIAPEKVEPYGRFMAKVPVSLIDEERVKKSRLILVTAISPTKVGIGKTTVSIGLAMGLNKIGKKASVSLREPSLGPCFGMKGGAAGGGYAQVLPMEKINLHFTGDFHAVTSAHNTISALLDNYLYQHRKDGFSLREIYWKRVLDVNDRALRNIVTGLRGDGVVSETGFDITPASELMAILCLATSEDDLRRRIENILLGITSDGKPFRVRDLGVGGAITVLMRDALSPNLVQTTEQTPAFIHGGPFANIAHGCSSVMATKMAMTFSDYVVTEAGFGADLGAEKFFNIKCRKAGLQPQLVVIVATTQGLKMHGGVALDHIKEPNADGLREGLKNLNRHINNMQGFGQPVIVTLNRFDSDTDEEIDIIRKNCEDRGVGFAVNEAFLKGGEGAVELAQKVVDTIERIQPLPINFTYPQSETIEGKIEKVCKRIYGAAAVEFTKTGKKRLEAIREIFADDKDISSYPICIAKTQYSFSADATRYGSPEGFTIRIRDVILNCGSEMIVAIAGDMLRMPGLPKSPQAERITIVNGEIEGLS